MPCKTLLEPLLQGRRRHIRHARGSRRCSWGRTRCHNLVAADTVVVPLQQALGPLLEVLDLAVGVPRRVALRHAFGFLALFDTNVPTRRLIDGHVQSGANGGLFWTRQWQLSAAALGARVGDGGGKGCGGGLNPGGRSLALLAFRCAGKRQQVRVAWQVLAGSRWGVGGEGACIR